MTVSLDRKKIGRHRPEIGTYATYFEPRALRCSSDGAILASTKGKLARDMSILERFAGAGAASRTWDELRQHYGHECSATIKSTHRSKLLSFENRLGKSATYRRRLRASSSHSRKIAEVAGRMYVESDDRRRGRNREAAYEISIVDYRDDKTTPPSSAGRPRRKRNDSINVTSPEFHMNLPDFTCVASWLSPSGWDRRWELIRCLRGRWMIHF